ncbi:uncharacterized protein LOC106636145 [Copidosoma floridanum]|uniref:uncharacterized protein LOC106636145 n=1 Tax=Copidosoma floridanum TaxID=29053 RepID=UPI0006C9B141|nr:uncharacterized protein LOC106636145 [Copidosoma floridanum]
MSCNLYSLNEELESIGKHTMDQCDHIAECIEYVNSRNDNVLSKKMLLLLGDSLSIKTHILKANDILYICGMELKKTRNQMLCESSTTAVKSSEEYQQFQKDYNLITNSITSIKTLLEEQSKLIGICLEKDEERLKAKTVVENSVCV